MVSLYATVGGAVTLVALILTGLWLTWISLQGDQHTPKPLRRDEADDTE